MVTEHVSAEPAQAPPHPWKIEPSSAAAVRVTPVPLAKLASQDPPQAIPAGLLETVPVPVPTFVTVSVWSRLKVAVTLLAPSMVTEQVSAEPAHAPLHSWKTEPSSGAAVSVTGVPLAKPAPHDAPQSIPAGLLVTVPPPVPSFVTVRVYSGTVTEALPLLPSLVAVTVAAPLPTPVTRPPSLTVATFVLLEDHVTGRPVKTLPSASRVVAVSCWV